MKCFKYYRMYNGGAVVRVSDAEAASLKGRGLGIYAPKNWFKAAKIAEGPTP